MNQRYDVSVALETNPVVSVTQTNQRDDFLDVIRSIAVVRVVLWHTFAGALISWSVASMPAMFFVAGSLLARSLEKSSPLALIRNRLKRLLGPFWVFASVVLSVLAIVHRIDGTSKTALSPVGLLRWVVPILDPQGNQWEAGWISAPLWYIRCYVWLLLLAPLLRRAYKKIGPILLLVPAAGVVGVDFIVRYPHTIWISPARWYLGDLATYSLFLIAGFAHHDGMMKHITRRARIEWAAIAFSAAFLWISVIPVPGRVVNNSYPLLVLVGAGWLGVFLALEQRLASLLQRPTLVPVLRWIGQRSMTIYLWHPTAIVGAFYVRSQIAPTAPKVFVLPIICALTIVLVVFFGWAEDISAKRAPQWWPAPSAPKRTKNPKQATRFVGIGAGLAATTFIAATAFGPAGSTLSASAADPVARGLALPPAPSGKPTQADFGSRLALPPAPSGKPIQADFGGSPSSETSIPSGLAQRDPAEVSPVNSFDNNTLESNPTDSTPVPPNKQRALEAAVNDWRTAHGVSGVVAHVSYPDGTFASVVSGQAADESPLDPELAVPVTSITKSFTAALILQLIDEGLIGLEDKLPKLDVAPEFPYAGKVTIHQLLQHTTGIANYADAPDYANYTDGEVTPELALQLGGSVPLLWEPGTNNGYSSTGFIVLGLLAEQLTGKTYGDLLQERFFDKFELASTGLDTTPRVGWLGYSSGGLISTSADLARWVTALYRDKSVLSPKALATMLDVNNKFSSGLGAFPICPCTTSNDGSRTYTSIGHHGGQADMQYSPKDRVSIGVELTESMWTDHLTQDNVAELLASLRAVTA